MRGVRVGQCAVLAISRTRNCSGWKPSRCAHSASLIRKRLLRTMTTEQVYYAPQDGAQMEPQQEVVAGEAGQLEGAQADLIALGHLAPLAGAEVGEDYMQQGGDQMPPQEPIQLQGPWERKKISDLRAFLLTKNLDTALLDSVLVMAGDPVTRINRAPKGEGRKRAAPTEGADGSDGNVEKRRRMPAAPDPNIPPEVQAMSVTELRTRFKDFYHNETKSGNLVWLRRKIASAMGVTPVPVVRATGSARMGRPPTHNPGKQANEQYGESPGPATEGMGEIQHDAAIGGAENMGEINPEDHQSQEEVQGEHMDAAAHGMTEEHEPAAEGELEAQADLEHVEVAKPSRGGRKKQLMEGPPQQ